MSDFVVKAEINGVEKKIDVVGNAPEPIATFDGVGYSHSINVADLDTSKMYDLEGNEIESIPSDAYYIGRSYGGPRQFWALKLPTDSSSNGIALSNDSSSYGSPIIEGAVENLNTNYLANAYIKIDEDDSNYATLYFNYVGEGSVTGPVSNEELDRNVNNLTTAIQGKQDKLTAGSNISIAGNVISASVARLEIPTSTTFYALATEVNGSPFHAKVTYSTGGDATTTAEGLGYISYNGSTYVLSIWQLEGGSIVTFSSTNPNAAISSVTPTRRQISFTGE